MGADPVRGEGILLCTWMSDCSRPQRGHCGLLVSVLFAHRCWSWVNGMGWHHPKLSKSLGMEQWRQHIAQGHQPYRRDCRTCVLNMAGAKPHRRRENHGSSAWTMAVDFVPLPRARDLATRKMVKYALVATALVPVFGDSETSNSSEIPKDTKKW